METTYSRVLGTNSRTRIADPSDPIECPECGEILDFSHHEADEEPHQVNSIYLCYNRECNLFDKEQNH